MGIIISFIFAVLALLAAAWGIRRQFNPKYGRWPDMAATAAVIALLISCLIYSASV